MLRFLTCGAVDDGKSTLIGRLLYDTKLIFEDQLATLEKDSRKHGTTGDDIDFALLVDGLEAEREQGITIDVAYRFFTTDKRSFIVADTPGHEQYTRNMATGASNSDLAVILIDARKGVLTQTKRHSYICSLLGIRHVVVAVNKIDWSIIPVRPSTTSWRTISSSHADCISSPSWRFRCRHASVTTSRAARPTCPGTRARPAARGTWKASISTRMSRQSRSASRCSGSTGRIWISAASRAPWRRERSAPETA
ncbi:MAG: 50S ribosome-binding GTPase [Blastocatellia bacterium]|nr:50S ribosome-binding GTPase [Blastocatellia bacterium]